MCSRVIRDQTGFIRSLRFQTLERRNFDRRPAATASIAAFRHHLGRPHGQSSGEKHPAVRLRSRFGPLNSPVGSSASSGSVTPSRTAFSRQRDGVASGPVQGGPVHDLLPH